MGKENIGVNILVYLLLEARQGGHEIKSIHMTGFDSIITRLY